MLLVSDIAASEAPEVRKAHAQRYITQVNAKLSRIGHWAALHEGWTRWNVVQEVQAVLRGALQSAPDASDLELHRTIVLHIHQARQSRRGILKALDFFESRKRRETYDLILQACDSSLSQEVHDFLRENVAFYLGRTI